MYLNDFCKMANRHSSPYMNNIVMNILRTFTQFALFLWVIFAFSQAVQAQTPIPDFLRAKGSPPTPEAKAWVLIESKTGWTITSNNPHERVDPASLTKLMTSYMAFEALDSGKIKADDKVFISEKAWKAPGSRMFLKVDTSATIAELLNGLIIQSGNDAAIALAEHLGGSESGFAQLMNEKAVQLGMSNTKYINSSGLPDEEHYTSAYDTAILSRALIRDYPDMYALFAVREYTYNEITQANRNRLLWRDDSYDGLKTGHTNAAGYCLAGSAARGNTRFIAVVMGAKSNTSRVQGVSALIEYGFTQYETTTVFQASVPVKSPSLYKGAQKTAEIGTPQAVSVLLPRGSAGSLHIDYQLPEKLVAPLNSNEAVGRANLSYMGNAIGHVELMPLQDYPLGPIWSQLIDAVKIKIF